MKKFYFVLLVKEVRDMKTENTVYCELCSTYVLKSNSREILFRKGSEPKTICLWCIGKIKEVIKYG